MEKSLIFLFILIVLLSVSIANYSLGQELEGEASSDSQAFQEALSNNGNFKGSFSQPQTINLPNGQSATVSGNVEVSEGEIAYADNLIYRDGNFRNVRNFKPTSDGYTANSVGQLQQDDVVITNGEGIAFSNGVLKAKHVDSMVKNKAVTTNINNLEVKTKVFSVEKADSLVSGGVAVTSIENTEFTISDKEITMKPKKGSTLHITGKSYIEADFEAFLDESEIKVSKEKSEYEIKNGRLNYSSNEYTDSVETNSTAKIEIDESGFGFKCMLLGIKSTYWYNDKKDLRKDFGVNVPDYGGEYKLCIKRLKNVDYKDYDGLIDFIDKNIFLSKVINYLKYPLKNNQISSLLSSFVYKGLQNVNVILSYDTNLIFLNNIFLTNKNNIKNQNLSVTYPNNYYTIKEMEIDGEVHSVIFLNLDLKKDDLTQNINYGYNTNYFEPKVSIKDNVFVQDNGKNRITILPPEHGKINEIIENVKKQ